MNFNSELNEDTIKVRDHDPVVRAKEDIRSAIRDIERAIDKVNEEKYIDNTNYTYMDPLSEKGKKTLEKLSAAYKHLKDSLKELDWTY